MIPPPARQVEGAASGRLKVLLFLHSADRDRVFASVLSAMLARGDEVLVAVDHHRGALPQTKTDLFDEMRERHPRLDYQQLGPRRDLWRIPASAIRRSLDYLRYLEPEQADADPVEALRDQARARAPGALRALLLLPPFRWRPGRRPLGWLLRRLEPGMPIRRSVKSLIKDQATDVVVVSPLAEFGFAHGDFMRTAEAARIPSVLFVVSWDDLAETGVIRDVPTRIVVSNESQVDEPVRVHGLPRARIAAVGAQSFNGLDAPAATGAVEAIERAASTEVVGRREGRILRPLLWLLTPLLALVLPLLRPRATARAVIKAVQRLIKAMRRTVKRVRKWARTRRKVQNRRRARRAEAKARAAKEERARQKALAHAAKEEEKARARAGKE